MNSYLVDVTIENLLTISSDPSQSLHLFGVLFREARNFRGNLCCVLRITLRVFHVCVLATADEKGGS